MQNTFAPRVFFPPKHQMAATQPSPPAPAPPAPAPLDEQHPSTPHRHAFARRFLFADSPASAPGTPRGYEGDIEDVDDQDTETIFLDRPRAKKSARPSQLSRRTFVLPLPTHLKTFGGRRDNLHEFVDTDSESDLDLDLNAHDVDAGYDSDAVYAWNADIIPANLEDVNEYYTPTEDESDNELRDQHEYDFDLERDQDDDDDDDDDASTSESNNDHEIAENQDQEQEQQRAVVDTPRTMGHVERRGDNNGDWDSATPLCVIAEDSCPIVSPGPGCQRRSTRVVTLRRRVPQSLDQLASTKAVSTTAVTAEDVFIQHRVEFDIDSRSLLPFLDDRMWNMLLRSPETKPLTFADVVMGGGKVAQPVRIHGLIVRALQFLDRAKVTRNGGYRWDITANDLIAYSRNDCQVIFSTVPDVQVRDWSSPTIWVPRIQ